MNSEQLLINKWRDLNSVQQQFVLDFVDFIAQKSLKSNQSQARVRRTAHGAGPSVRDAPPGANPLGLDRETPTPVSSRVKQWIDWTSDNPDESPGLPDEALSRDSIYSED
jgi:hypothetical protein